MQSQLVPVYLGLLMALLGWLQPLHLLPWVSWHSEVPVFAGVLLVAGVALLTRWRAGTKSFGMPSGVWLLLALLALALLQAVTGMIHFVGDAVVLALYLGLCIVCWLLGYHVLSASDDPSHARWPTVVAWTLLAAALISSVIAIVQVLDVWDNLSWINRMPQSRRPGANMGQPNHLGTLLLMGLASLIYLRESGSMRGGVAGLTIASLLMLALAATESRTAVIGLLLLCLWCLLGYYRAGLRMRPRLPIAASLVFLLLYWSWPMLITSAEQMATAGQINTKPGMRLVVWPQLVDAVKLRPWLGWGLREVSEAQNAVVHAYESSESYSYAHNLVLEAALGVGIPLTVLAGIAVAYWLYRRIRASKQLLAWYCLAAVLPVAVHSMLEFPFAYAYFLAPVMLLFGMLDASIKANTVGSIGVRSAAAGLLVMAVLAAWTVVEYVSIEEDFRIARFEAMRVGCTPEEYARPRLVLLTQLAALLEDARVSPTTGMASDRIDLLRAVALRYPWPATQNRYALALVLNGQEAEGLRQLKVIRAMHGEQIYLQIKAEWKTLSEEKFPQLLALEMP